MKRSRKASTRNAFSEARRMIANQLYVPTQLGKVEVTDNGIEPVIRYIKND